MKSKNTASICSMPLQPDVFASLKSLLAPVPAPADDGRLAQASELESEVQLAPPTGDDVQDVWSANVEVGPEAAKFAKLVFWQVVKAGDLARALRAHAEGESELKGLMAVTLHSVLAVGLTSLHSHSVAMTLNPFSVPLEVLEDVMVWKKHVQDLSMTLSFEYLHGLPRLSPQVLPSVLSKVAAAASHGGYNPTLGEREAAGFANVQQTLGRLAGDGIIEGPPWTITAKGSDLTRTCAALKVERRLLSTAQAGCSPHDMTAFKCCWNLRPQAGHISLLLQKSAGSCKQSSTFQKQRRCGIQPQESRTQCVCRIFWRCCCPQNMGKPCRISSLTRFTRPSWAHKR